MLCVNFFIRSFLRISKHKVAAATFTPLFYKFFILGTMNILWRCTYMCTSLLTFTCWMIFLKMNVWLIHWFVRGFIVLVVRFQESGDCVPRIIAMHLFYIISCYQVTKKWEYALSKEIPQDLNGVSITMILATAELLQYLDLIIKRAKSVEWCFLIHALIYTLFMYRVDADGTKKCMR